MISFLECSVVRNKLITKFNITKIKTMKIYLLILKINLFARILKFVFYFIFITDLFKIK